MANVIGIQFQKNGKMYTFSAGEFHPAVGDYVIVDTIRGHDLGEVIMGEREIEVPENGALKSVIRMATEQDLQTATENRAKEREAFAICQRKISEHQLEMKLVSVEYTFDSSKILFYFTANGRVDFRSLVKDLASVFKTRIELRQIGVRDEARMLGGLGPCGRTICCGSFLADFQPVSIKMAKEQNLSLNPTKISGVCGRLLCCLKYEQDHYEQTRKRMPRVGREVGTPDGTGTVTELNIVKETVKVRIASGDTSEIKEFPLESITRSAAKQDVKPDAEPAEDAEVNPPPCNEAEAAGTVPEKDRRVPEQNSEEAHPHGKKGVKSGKAQKNQPREAQGANVPRNKSDRQLGHPVRRDNPRKSPKSISPGAGSGTEIAGSENRIRTGSGPAEKTEKKTNWASQLEQAFRAIEPGKQGE